MRVIGLCFRRTRICRGVRACEIFAGRRQRRAGTRYHRVFETYLRYRVREGHRVLEGVRLPKEDPFWKKYFPPNGWNCRCTTLEIWKDEPTAKIDFGITGRDPRKRTSDAMNVPKEFRGNVGIFAISKKYAKKKSKHLYKNPKFISESTLASTTKPIRGIQRGTFIVNVHKSKPGKLTGYDGMRTASECKTINELLEMGYDVKIIPESKKQKEKTPDIFIKWKKRKRIAVEMKNPTSSTYSTIKSHISHAIKQGCELLLLDLRNSPIAFNEIDVIIKRTIGSRPSRSLPIDLEVWINEYGKRRVYKRKKG